MEKTDIEKLKDNLKKNRIPLLLIITSIIVIAATIISNPGILTDYRIQIINFGLILFFVALIMIVYDFYWKRNKHKRLEEHFYRQLKTLNKLNKKNDNAEIKSKYDKMLKDLFDGISQVLISHKNTKDKSKNP